MYALGAFAIIVLVLALTYYATRWYARRMGGGGAGKYMKVHDRVAMGSAAAVAIIEVSGRFYLLGIGDKSVQMLCELPDFDPDDPDSAPASKIPFVQVFSEFLDKARKSPGKRDDGGEE